MPGRNLLDRIADIEARLAQLEKRGAAIQRDGTIEDFDTDAWTASVTVSGTTYTSVPLSQDIRSDLLQSGASCVVLFCGPMDSSYGRVLALYGEKPQDDPRFDPEYGHKHRGLANDGPRLSHAELDT